MDIHVLQIIWFILLGVLFIGYSILDGFDLGIGSLMPFLAKDEKEQRILFNSIGPVWDGNEVWLLTAGGALFAAFPHAYATVFSGFYMALMVVLLALIFRAVSFEFYTNDENKRKLWSFTFFLGSLVPALLFGVALGNLIAGIPLVNMEYYGEGPFMRFLYLLRPFPLVIGLLGLTAFLLQGSVYAMLKTEDEIYSRARNIAGLLLNIYPVMLLVAFAASLVFLDTQKILGNITGWIFLAVVIISLYFLRKSVAGDRPLQSFILSSAAFAGLWGMAGSYLFPNLVVNNAGKSITIYNASSSQLTLTVMLIIALIGVPVMLAYTYYVYRIFKGKTIISH